MSRVISLIVEPLVHEEGKNTLQNFHGALPNGKKKKKNKTSKEAKMTSRCHVIENVAPKEMLGREIKVETS